MIGGELGKHFAVDGDSGQLKTVNEAAVFQSERAASGVDAEDPQLMEFAFAQFAVAVGMLAGLGIGVFGLL